MTGREQAGAKSEPGSLPLANARHERFCQEYLIDRNATAAYQRAGYRANGHAAEVGASQILRKPQVSARVAYLEAQRAERVGMTADQVLRELAILGTSDVRHYTFSGAGLALAEDAPDEAMRAVQSVKRRVRRVQKDDGPAEEIEEVEYRLWNKPAALRMAGEHHGLFKHVIEDVTPGVTLGQVSDEEVFRVLVLRVERLKEIRDRENALRAAGAKQMLLDGGQKPHD
ncbi:MAG TPA: terminase small subunit [Gemmatimonadales bacterium]